MSTSSQFVGQTISRYRIIEKLGGGGEPLIFSSPYPVRKGCAECGCKVQNALCEYPADSDAGRFLTCEECGLSFKFPAGISYDKVARQFPCCFVNPPKDVAGTA
jgi:hypothetical protein